MRVEVFDDIACPWSRLGTHQFHRAMAAAGAETDVECGVNVADHTRLTEPAERVGLGRARVRSFLPANEGSAEVREQLAAARREGVTTVPRFVFDDGEVSPAAGDTFPLRPAGGHRADGHRATD